MPPTVTQAAGAAASSTSNAPNALLSTNDDISLAALIVTFIVGILTALQVYLYWTHLEWEPQPDPAAAANARDGLENTTHAETYEMQSPHNQSNREAIVEEHPDGTSADNTSNRHTVPSSVGGGLHETRGSISGGHGGIQGHMADSDRTSQHSDPTQPSNGQPKLESDASMPLHAKIQQSFSSTKANVNGVDDSISSDDKNIQGHIAGGDHSQRSELTQPGSESETSKSLRVITGLLVSSINVVADDSPIVDVHGVAKTSEGDPGNN